MGWNTSALFVRGATVGQSLALLPGGASASATGATVSAERAMSSQAAYGEVFVATVDGWCQVWDPSMSHLGPGGTPPAAEATLSVILASVASTYGFQLVIDGDLRRHVVWADGDPVVDVGRP